jgi:hypothetical protein
LETPGVRVLPGQRFVSYVHVPTLSLARLSATAIVIECSIRSDALAAK